ncbi:MAG TPA: helix-turn-helix domain-containing protein [Solirubrobacterales bacterium]|nr:helix-turn-helix domain-containing protein [Solirubrobacterales bacterium]
MARESQAVDVAPRNRRRRSGSGDRLLRPFSHPIRIEIIRILRDRVASPKELAAELGETLSDVTYHVKCLEKAACVELTATAKRRGAVEHYYRSRRSEGAAVLAWRGLIAEAARALNAGALNADDEQALAWTTLELDEQGRQELARRQAAWNEELRRIEAEATDRLGRAKEPSAMRLVAGTIAFETPGTAAAAASATR